MFNGFIDSLRGVTVLLYLDKEINEKAIGRSSDKDNENKQKNKIYKLNQ